MLFRSASTTTKVSPGMTNPKMPPRHELDVFVGAEVVADLLQLLLLGLNFLADALRTALDPHGVYSGGLPFRSGP